MAAEYDVFLSHAWADGERVWFDAHEIDDFAGITRAVTEGLAKSKALLAYYSKTYPLRRACQWELTAAFLAAQNEGDPRRRVLVINPESGADHIHPIELRDAKFRDAPNTDGEMQQLVQAIVKQVGQLSGPLADIHPLTAPNWYGTTPVGSTRFVGRLKEMWEVHSLLHAGDVAQITGAPAATAGIGQVQGLGGVGKSLLAEEYALHFGAAYPGGVFWLRAYGNDDAKGTLGATERAALHADQVRGLAERLGIDTHGLTAEQIEGALARKIASENKPCLWVVDDIPNGLDGDALRRWFAPHSVARTLVTTRSREYGALANGIDLSVLTPDEAFQLLTSRRKPANDDEEEQARGLASDLGYHALALDVTGSALVSFGAAEPFREFRAELAREDEDALELAKDLADALPNGHEKSIAKTLLRSIVRLGLEGRDFLRLASVLAVAPIPASLARTAFEKADKLNRNDAQRRQAQAFHQVTTASLAEVAGELGDSRAVHTLVSRTVRFQDAGLVRTGALRAAAVETLLAEIAQAARDPRLHKQIEFHVAHARQVVAMPETVPEANLLGWVGWYDDVRGAYASARTLRQRALEFCQHAQGEDHPNTLTARNNLAQTLKAQGDLVGARQHEEQALEARRRLLGEDHPDTLGARNNLAQTLHAQGDLAGARQQQEQVLEASRRLLGEDHPDTLRARNNLAQTLKAQGDLAGARQHEEHVLEASRRLLGEEHPDTLKARNNLAATLYAQGDLAGARQQQEQVLEASRRLLGEEHPDTLRGRNNLAATLKAQGDLVGARQHEEHVLEASRRLLGEEHPDTLTARLNLAGTLYAQGDLADARQQFEQVLAGRRRLLGEEHPDTLTARNNLAQTLHAQGDLAGARQQQEQVLEARRRRLGEDHPATLSARHNLALTLWAQGDLAGARQEQELVLEARQRLLSEEHPDTLKARNNLAQTLKAQGDLAGARQHEEQVLEASRRLLGEDHPDTSISAWNLFLTLRDLGDRAAARTVMERELLWLLDRDPATLGADQRKIREYVAQVVKKSG